MSKTKLNVNEIKIKEGRNFRIEFDKEGFEELKLSLANRGLLQPIVIDEDNYLIAGERRLRAARELGWKTIEVSYFKCENEDDKIAAGIEENFHRRTYSKSDFFRAAAWYKGYCERKGMIINKKGKVKKGKDNEIENKPTFVEHLSDKTGQSKTTINENVKIGETMTEKMAQAIDSGEMTKKQALEISKVEDEKKRDEIVDKVKGKTLDETKEIIEETVEETKETKKVKKTSKTINGINADVWLKGLINTLNKLNDDIYEAFEKEAWEKVSFESKVFFKAVNNHIHHVRALEDNFKSLIMEKIK